MSSILSAARIAANVHRGQVRRNNGRPYESHVFRVGGRSLSHPRVSEAGGCASYLHDTLEERPERYEQIKKQIITECGDEAFGYVLDLTNPSKGQKGLPRADRKRLDRAHLATRLPMVKVIKLIDRIDNLFESLIDVMGGLDKDYDFNLLYCQESEALLNEALIGTDSDLEVELLVAVERLRKVCETKKHG